MWISDKKNGPSWIKFLVVSWWLLLGQEFCMIFWLYASYVVDWFTFHWQVGSHSREATWGFDRNARMEMEHEEGKENQPRVAFPTMWCWT